MAEGSETESSQERLRVYQALRNADKPAEARQFVNELHPSEIAQLLESLPPDQRQSTWELVDPDFDGDVLLYVNEDLRESLIRGMEPNELVAAAEQLETDDLADIIQDLPEEVIEQVLQAMDHQDRLRLEAVLSYPDDTAGGLMNTDTVTVRPDVTLDVVLRYLRLRGSIPEMTDNLIVVDRDDHYQGLLRITDLLVRPGTKRVADVMQTDIVPLDANLSAGDVASMFEHRDLVSAPVVDSNGRLIGRITIDDVVDVIREEADHSIMSMAGLKEELDVYAPIVRSARRRGVWLGANLLTVLIASWVIGQFEESIAALVILAVLMPIVASMGGIAGSQTLTVVIRGMALGHIGPANAMHIVRRELGIGLINGAVWAAVVGAITVAWFGDYAVAAIIACAILINLTLGVLCGALVPLAIRRFGGDPALGGSVILTGITDAVGFFVFLGLATVLVLN